MLVDAKGDLVMPILDYEHDGPDRLAADYDAVRPPFAETGTPRLPIGLNLGAQLFCLGLLGEIIVRLYFGLKVKKPYVVDRVL